MSKITTQLREQAAKLATGPRGIAWGHALLMTTAADEIDRLEAEVSRLELAADAAWEMQAGDDV